MEYEKRHNNFKKENRLPFSHYTKCSPEKSKYDFKLLSEGVSFNRPQTPGNQQSGVEPYSPRATNRLTLALSDQKRSKSIPRIMSNGSLPEMITPQQLEQLYRRRPQPHTPALNSERNEYVQSKYWDTKKCVYDLMKDAYHLKAKIRKEKEI